MAQLKVLYEKYFMGLEKIEPMKDRDEVRALMRDLDATRFASSVQRHRFQMLRARFVSLDQYIARNLYLIERGVHPRFAFRANLAQARRAEETAAPPVPPPQVEVQQRLQREEDAYRQIFDRYIEARRACGQATDLEYATVRDSLRRHARTIRSRYRCESVRFQVSVENGRATLKASPHPTSRRAG
ncbi:MAG: hypothetical protein JXB39_15385 [Deltaproteobacteria bacterium]|nr:hypothetical protein [Deltaproteobacteria bacterium]